MTNRTWTISSHPDETAKTGTFSISVKRVGLASGWLHAQDSPSKITIEWRGAGGEFVPGPGAGPVLLIAGGIGEGLLVSLLFFDIVAVFKAKSPAALVGPVLPFCCLHADIVGNL